MLKEEWSVKRIGGNAPSAQAAEDCAGEAAVFEYLTLHRSAVALDDAVDHITEEGLIIAEEACR